jgi:hypothetical protein
MLEGVGLTQAPGFGLGQREIVIGFEDGLFHKESRFIPLLPLVSDPRLTQTLQLTVFPDIHLVAVQAAGSHDERQSPGVARAVQHVMVEDTHVDHRTGSPASAARRALA